MAEITCPMCGKPNPADRDVCQYCEARLKPLTDELSRSQPPIRPGEEPTDRDTGELETVLPQWLRDIRQQARDSLEEGEQPPAAEGAGQQGEEADLLAGLRSESESEEEVPDWLSGLRTEGGQVDFEETSEEPPGEEDDLAPLKGMLGEDTTASQEDETSALPAWLADLDAGESEESTPSQPETPAASADMGWNADFETGPASEAEPSQDNTTFDGELPAWMQDTGQTPANESQSDLPAWLASLGAEEEGGTVPSPEAELDANSTADWLASLEGETAETASTQEDNPPTTEGELPDWLATLGEESSEETGPSELDETAATGHLPDWLASLGEESETPPQKPVETPPEFKAPDWPSSLGEAGTTDEDQADSTEEELAAPAQADSEAEIPDWAATVGQAVDETEEPAEEVETPTYGTELEADKAPTFVDDEGQPISSEDVDAIFSMDMPDWLSDAKGRSETEIPTAEEPSGDELRPAELPSWVQAMRPVESVLSETERTPLEEQPQEERGPLAGLRGVLPAVPGVQPTSKPEAHSIKLLASEEQLSNAAMLEKMLAEEVNPKPVSAPKVVLNQRILRWLIAAVLILVVGGTIYYNPQINPIPTAVPPETSAALDYIKNALPTNAPVLLIFDYDAARAGELEAAAAPLVDQMLTLKAPRLTLVASTPTGSGLAERFMQILQADREYARNENFINLGYLPGGAAGVQAFSKDPVSTKQFTTTGEGAWTTPTLQGVSQLSNFAAIFLLTDDVETARIWIEQTEIDRGEARLLVVSSAQSGPMIRPYVRSGQVDGMVSGLEGSAPIEQSNSGRPGMARRYWDAYGFGLLAAVVMIALGSLWIMVAGFRALRKEGGQG